ESETQQKVVVPSLVRYKRRHLARATSVEQKVAIGGDQVRVTWLESQRGAKVRFGGGMVATAVGNLAGQGQRPFAQCRIGVGSVCERADKRKVSTFCVARKTGRCRVACGEHQRHG